MESLVGEIRLLAIKDDIIGWFMCDGKEYDVQQYRALYELIGNTYGGTPNKKFAVPDLVGAQPDPYMMYYICIEGDWPNRS